MEAPSQDFVQDPSSSRRSPSPKQVTKRTKIAPAVPAKPAKKIKKAAPADTTDSAAASAPLSVPREVLLQCQNLTKLPLLYPQTVLECVRERCLATKYYTWAGPTLVAVNPCHSVPVLYRESEVLHYHQALQSGVSPLRPHVYAVAGTAEHRRTCGLGRINQAVVVSGESGAGKTESARYMLSYLCQVEDFANGGTNSSPGCDRTASHALRPHVDRAPESSDSGFDTSHGPDAVVARTQAKVLASNPLLEAFGNAATLRNHNSSRFGKLLRLQYGGNELRGAVVDTYLLEKTRVTHQPQGERNFHILHQIVAGMQAGVLSVDGCRVPSLPSQPPTLLPPFTITPITAADDVRGLHCTLAALDQLSFSRAHQDNLLRVLVALLHLGNVQFEVQSSSSPGCVVTESSLSNLARASGLLGVSCEQLSEALTVRTIAVPTKDRVSVFRHSCERPVECYERRSACMQLLYHGLFAHLITAVNEQIAAKPRHAWSHFIGILDVYGFEAFEHNSLEQLCINYANERLQQAFIETFLRTEQQVLLEEGVVVDERNLKDNSGCLTALHSPVSVFTILNEECQLQRAVDEVAACERVCRALQHSEFVYSPANSRSKGTTSSSPSKGSQRSLAPSPTGFVVRHYAGPVHYSPVSLLAKNKDLVPGEVVALLGQSEDPFVAGLLEQEACRAEMGTEVTTQQEKMNSRWSSSPTLSTPTTAPPPECPSSITPHNTGSLRRPSTPTAPHTTPSTGGSNTGSLRRGARKVTTLSKFKSSLDALLGTLASCDLHYVRCVKPNRLAVVGTTNDDYLMSQLSACGILDTVAVCQAGYPVRMVFEEFYNRYGERGAVSQGKEGAERILKETVCGDGPDQTNLFSVGKRRVFLSEAALRQLEAVRDHKRAAAACVIQTNWRRAVCMRSYRSLRSAAATVVRCAATWRARRHFLRTRSAAITLQRYVRGRNERLRFCAIKDSSFIIQKTVRMWLARKRFLKLRCGVVLLQSHVRRVLAQRSFRTVKMIRVTAAASRSPSNYSITSSVNSFGYQTGSLSLYSLESASHTPSPDHALTSMTDAITTNSNVLRPTSRVSQDRLQCFPPATRRSVLETEESGIETDTESMSGDREATDGDDQARVRRRRAKLRQMQIANGELVEESQLSGASTDTQNERSANAVSEERLPVHSSVRARHNRLNRSTSNGANQNLSTSVPIPSQTEFQSVPQSSQSKVDPFGPTSNDIPSSVTVRRRKRKSTPSILSSDPNLVKINSSHQLMTVLGMFATKPEVRFMYSSESRDFYFKDGIISQRRIPPIPMRFHVRATCLPFSHHLPRALQPQGLLDALQ